MKVPLAGRRWVIWIERLRTKPTPTAVLVALTGGAAMVFWFYIAIASKFLPTLLSATVNDLSYLSGRQLAAVLLANGIVVIIGLLGLAFLKLACPDPAR